MPADLLMALAYRESNWNAQALSRSGAMGIGQLMPSTVAYVTTRLLKSPTPLDPWDPADNIWMSGRTLRNLLDLTGGDPVRALAAYYQGFGSLTRQGILPIGQRYADSILAQRPASAPADERPSDPCRPSVRRTSQGAQVAPRPRPYDPAARGAPR